MSKAVEKPSFWVGVVMVTGGLFSENPQLVYAGVAMMIAATIPEPELDLDKFKRYTDALITQRSPAAPWQVIYGDRRSGGILTYILLSGTNHQYLNSVITLAGHEVDSINDMYINAEPCNLEDSGGGLFVPGSTNKFAGKVQVVKRLGTTTQTVITELKEESKPDWVAWRMQSGNRASRYFAEVIRFNGEGQWASSSAVTTYQVSELSIVITIRLRSDVPGTIFSYGGNKLELVADRFLKFTDQAGNTVTSSAQTALHRRVDVIISGNSAGLTFDAGNKLHIEWYLHQEDDRWGYAGSSGTAMQKDFDNNSIGTGFTSEGEEASWIGPDGEWEWNERPTTYGAASSNTGFDMGSGAANVYLASDDGTIGFWSGEINTIRIFSDDDPLIWGATQTVDQFQAFINNAGVFFERMFLTFITTSRLAYWKITEGAGDTIADSAAGANTITIKPVWTDDHRQRGRAYVWVRLQWDAKIFNGMPNLTFDVKGKKVYDPRDTLTDWSDNAALCIADYLIDTSFGMGIVLADVDVTVLSAAANVCEEAVPILAGGNEDRYTCNGSFTVDQEPSQIIETLLTALGGQLTYVGGKWKIYAAAYRAPTDSLDEGDFTSPITINALITRQQAFNSIQGLFFNPDADWQRTNYPPVTNSTYETEDGGERISFQLDLPFTTSPSRCQRLAKISLERHRQAITISVGAKLSAFVHEPPNVVQINYERMGWVNKEFEISEGNLKYDDKGQLGYALAMRETAEGVYDWTAAGDETTLDLAVNTLLPNPFAIIPPSGLLLTSGTETLFLRLDGTVMSRIRVEWDDIEDEYVLTGGHIDVQYKRSIDSDWEKLGFIDGNEIEAFILDVEDGTNYDVRARSVNASGIQSDWFEITDHTVIGKTAPPLDVIGFKGVQNGETVTFLWDHNTDVDLAGYETRYAAIGLEWEDAITLTQTTRGTRVTDAAVPPGNTSGGIRQPWKFFIKAVDTSGNESLVADTFELLVTPIFDPNFIERSFPIWSGARTNLYRNPLKGHLNPQSTDADSTGDNQDVFDNYVLNPETSFAYESEDIDSGLADRDDSRVWVVTDLGAGGGIGVPTVETGLDYSHITEVFDGFEPWTLGTLQHRYFKLQATDDDTLPLTVFRDLQLVIDLLEHNESGPLTIPVGGLHVAFTKLYRDPPRVTVDEDANEAVFFGITIEGFDIWILTSGGVDVGGTAIYSAVGR